MLSRWFTRKELLAMMALAGAIGVGAVTLIWMNGRAVEPQVEVIPANPMASQAPVANPVPEVPVPLVPAEAAPMPMETLPPVEAPPPAPATLRVSVAGAVAEPGVYEFQGGDRVEDALESAGGPLPEADLSDINRAARLLDGTTLTVTALPHYLAEQQRATGYAVPMVRVPNPPQYTISQWQGGSATGAAPANPAGTGGEAVAPAASVGASSGLLDLNRATVQELEGLPGIGEVLAAEIVRQRSIAPFTSVDDLQRVRGIGDKRIETVRSLVTVGKP